MTLTVSPIDNLVDQFVRKAEERRAKRSRKTWQGQRPTGRPRVLSPQQLEATGRLASQDAGSRRYLEGEVYNGPPPPAITRPQRDFAQGIVNQGLTPQQRSEEARRYLDAGPRRAEALRRNVTIPVAPGAESFFLPNAGQIVSEPAAMEHELTHAVDYTVLAPSERRDFLATALDLARRDPFVRDVLYARHADGRQLIDDPQHVYTYFSALAPGAVPAELRKFYDPRGTSGSRAEELFADGGISAVQRDIAAPEREARAEALRGIGVLQPATDPLTRGVRKAAEIANRPIPPLVRAGEGIGEALGTAAGTIEQAALGRTPRAPVSRRPGEDQRAVQAGANRQFAERVSEESAAGQANEFVGETILPDRLWMIALEFAPGFGTVPGITSALRNGSPDALRAVRRAVASERGQAILKGGETGEFRFNFLDRKLKESKEIVRTYDETLKLRGLGPEKRAELQAERVLAQQRHAILADIAKRNREVPDLENRVLGVPDEDMAGSLAAERQAIEDELERRAIPFGGRAGISPKDLRNQRARGARARRMINKAYPELDTPALNARRDALEQLEAELPEGVRGVAQRSRFDSQGNIIREDVLAGDRGEQGDLLGSPQTTGEGSSTESSGPMFREQASEGLTPPEPTTPPGDRPPVVGPSDAGTELPGARSVAPAGDRPPTIREIEGRSAPLTPAQRARMPRDTERAFYQPQDFAESTDEASRAIAGGVSGALQRVQNIAADVPIVRSLAGFTEPMAAARAQRRAGNVIPEAMVRRDLFVDGEKSRARAGLYAWIDRNREVLGLDGKGIARRVGVVPDAEIPRLARGRLDDIIEHPEDYVLSAEQESAIAEIRHTLNAVTQRQLDAGVDVREVEGGYFPRIVTRSPKGEPKPSGGGSRLVGKPGHAKAREFADIREGFAAKYEYADPFEALQARLDTGIESIGRKRTFETVKALGEKPSERVPQALRDAYLDAKEAYKAARTPENEKLLEDAKRALRVAATKAGEPRIGEEKAFSRIFPAEVVQEIAKYTDVQGPGLIEEFFRVQRASTTTADLSAAFIQGGNLFYRHNVAWWKALGYSIASTAREPFGYVARNIDVIDEGIKARAIVAPTEFQLKQGGGLSRMVAPLPVVKQAQRAFEWMIFVGQTEWWRAARKIATTDAERAELASVIRKATGSMLRPGLTSKQRQAEAFTFFAGKFLMAVNGLAADALRGGVRGGEARKTIGSLIAGATSLTIAGQLATDGTMPNLTDPRNRDKAWLSIKRPGGTVNLFGPLYPYIKAYASIAQNVAEGKPADAADDALFLGRSRLSLPLSSLIELIYDENVVGESVRGPRQFLESQARRFAPISVREVAEDGIESLREFPEGLAQGTGLRTNRASEYRQGQNAADRYVEDTGGDFRAAMQAAIASNDTEAINGIKGQWRNDLRPQLDELGVVVIPGASDEETGLARGPRLDFPEITKALLANPYWGKGFQSELGIDVAGAQTLTEIRARYIDEKKQELAQRDGLTLDEARDRLAAYFDQSEIVSGTVLKRDKSGGVSKRAKDGYRDFFEQHRLYLWSQHPELFWDAVAVGWEDDSEVERTAIPRP